MKDTFIIQGGKPLHGEVILAGAKNAATKMLIASLLTEEEVILENFPRIGDTDITLEFCKSLGSEVAVYENVVRIKTPEIKTTKVESLSRRNRIPILALGPLLSRKGEAEIPFLGGDKIGPRPVDLHLKALQLLGAEIEVGEHSYKARAPKGLRGTEIKLDFPSVGATENTILAAVRAEGKTLIRNAAFEPEVIDVIKLLQNMGAVIELGTNRDISIEGVPSLRGVRYSILPDRNEAVSFACLALLTKGEIFIKDALQDHLITFLNAVRRIGGSYAVKDGGIRFWREGDLRAIDIETNTHPGFMTDWQQPFVVVLTSGKGISTIHETIYEDRFGYAKDLNLMGAAIKVFEDCPEGSPCRLRGLGSYHRAVIEGGTSLHGAELTVPDLRAGIAHVVAALAAKGESQIHGVHEIDRGYEALDERLRFLGADIKRIS